MKIIYRIKKAIDKKRYSCFKEKPQYKSKFNYLIYLKNYVQ